MKTAYTHAEKLIMNAPAFVAYVSGKSPEYGAIYAYLLTDKERMAAYEHDSVHNISMTFADYGTVLSSGFGVPDEHEKHNMRLALLERVEHLIKQSQNNPD